MGKGGKNMKVYTEEEVAKHNSEKDAWVISNGAVFDVTTFIPDHPGGVEVLKEFLGNDVSQAMVDPLGHVHSGHSFNMLEQYKIGYVEGSLHTSDKFDGESSANEQEYNDRVSKIDMKRGLVWQVGNLGKYYHKWVHIPQPPNYKIRYFENPILEYFSKMSWQMVPIFWLPIVAGLLYMALTSDDELNEFGYVKMAATFGLGMFLWSFFEYMLHRYLFHYRPESWFTVTFHFILHGSHHLSPMDRQRLVFPVVPASMLASVIIKLMSYFFPDPFSYAAYAGVLVGYIVYDLTHYYLHHGSPKAGFFKAMKTHHLHHHYKTQLTNFGISGKFLDVVFGTLDANSEAQARMQAEAGKRKRT